MFEIQLKEVGGKERERERETNREKKARRTSQVTERAPPFALRLPASFPTLWPLKANRIVNSRSREIVTIANQIIVTLRRILSLSYAKE